MPYFILKTVVENMMLKIKLGRQSQNLLNAANHGMNQ